MPQKRRQIEQRRREDLTLDQEQGYEQASDSAVAIKKRVNGQKDRFVIAVGAIVAVLNSCL